MEKRQELSPERFRAFLAASAEAAFERRNREKVCRGGTTVPVDNRDSYNLSCLTDLPALVS